ncbi:hypothetical protein KSF78_0000147 [Schistosoma japonicum]|nr:hypothetical protein KSF78_0000147 [Schistosoma japonicum]
MKMRGSAYQLVTCILTLVIFTGTTLTQLEKEEFKELWKKILYATSRKQVDKNDTCVKVDYYYYIGFVCMNGILDKNVVVQLRYATNITGPSTNLQPKFKLKFYGREYNTITISKNGTTVKQDSMGTSNTVQIVPLFAKPDSLYIQYRSTTRVVVVVYSDGRITIFYEDIPTEIDKYCSKETSEQACRGSSIPGVECYWCIKPEICTNKADTNADIWIKNNCDNAEMSEENKSNPSLSTSNSSPTQTTSTSPTTSKQEATRNAEMSEENKSNPSLSTSNSSPTQTTSTSPTTSKQEATRKTTMSGETVMSSVTPSLSVQNKNSSIPLIIIISVGCLLILLIVLAIWFLMRRKLHVS